VVCAEGATGWPMQGTKVWECMHVLCEVQESMHVYVEMRECKQMDFYYVLPGK
jgi:hypothetical protein